MQVTLSGKVAIAKVSKIKQELDEALAANEASITVDLSTVETVDTAGVQLLFAFYRDARASGVEVLWCEVPPRLCDTASQLGFDLHSLGWAA